MSYAYDQAGRRTSMTIPEVGQSPGGSVNYTYDTAGRLATTSIPGGTTGDVIEYRYLADGRIDTIERPNNVTTTHSYDGAGRLVGLLHEGASGELLQFNYTLDQNGNRVAQRWSENGGTETTETYTLNDLQRITGVDYGNGTAETYTYDAAGNRTRRETTGGPGGGITNYHYDQAQQLTAIDGSAVPGGATTFTHDENGNLTSTSAGDTYEYDANNALVAATTSHGSMTAEFDATGVRVSVNGEIQLQDVTGNLPVVVANESSAFLELGAGQVLAASTTSDTTYPLADALGSIRGTTDRAGSLTATASYSVYGAAGATSPLDGFGYAGEQIDPAGIMHLRARAYDPNLGRFLQADSLQPNAPGTTGYQLYGYGNANPTTLTDPSGFDSGTLVREAVQVREELSTSGRTSRSGKASGSVLGGYAVVVATGALVILGASVVLVMATAPMGTVSSCLEGGTGTSCPSPSVTTQSTIAPTIPPTTPTTTDDDDDRTITSYRPLSGKRTHCESGVGTSPSAFRFNPGLSTYELPIPGQFSDKECILPFTFHLTNVGAGPVPLGAVSGPIDGLPMCTAASTPGDYPGNHWDISCLDPDPPGLIKSYAVQQMQLKHIRPNPVFAPS